MCRLKIQDVLLDALVSRLSSKCGNLLRSSLEFAARHEMLVVAQEDVSLLFEEGRFRSCRRMVKEMPGSRF